MNTTLKLTGHGRIRTDNGSVVAYLDETPDGTVTLSNRAGELLATFPPRSLVHPRWRHQTAHTDALAFAQRTICSE